MDAGDAAAEDVDRHRDPGRPDRRVLDQVDEEEVDDVPDTTYLACV